MAHLGDTDLSEKSRIALLVVATSGVVVLTALALHLAEALWVFVAIDQQTPPVRAALHLALWGGVMLLLSRLREILRGAGTLASGGVRFVSRLPLFFIRSAFRGLVLVCRIALGIIPALLRLVLGDGYELIAINVRLWCDPAFRLRDRMMLRVAPVIARVHALQAALAQERALRRAYREEFKNSYTSYRAFRAAFNAKGAEQGDATTAADPFSAACAALGLREDGRFSHDEFKAQYRAVMKAIHPDVAGANDKAASINGAAAVIKQRKNWK
ncbi:MAG: hypothetical protein AB7T86_04990 [Xanthobacteraceae bacterium]